MNLLNLFGEEEWGSWSHGGVQHILDRVALRLLGSSAEPADGVRPLCLEAFRRTTGDSCERWCLALECWLLRCVRQTMREVRAAKRPASSDWIAQAQKQAAFWQALRSERRRENPAGLLDVAVSLPASQCLRQNYSWYQEVRSEDPLWEAIACVDQIEQRKEWEVEVRFPVVLYENERGKRLLTDGAILSLQVTLLKGQEEGPGGLVLAPWSPLSLDNGPYNWLELLRGGFNLPVP